MNPAYPVDPSAHAQYSDTQYNKVELELGRRAAEGMWAESVTVIRRRAESAQTAAVLKLAAARLRMFDETGKPLN